MTLQADLYWSFRSPYCYLSGPRYLALSRERDLDIRMRPVWPIAVRDPGFFARENPQWIPYLLRDTARVAEFNGMPFGRPEPDPIVQDVATGAIAAEQPFIRRITRLGVVAARRGPAAGMDFAVTVGHALWGERVKDWHVDENLGPILARAGLDLSELQAEVDGAEAALDAEVQANQDALDAAGHWGVPTLVFDGEPFFGQDRIELAIWTMEKKGLGTRA